jgi:adenylate kinase family enzyme
LHIAGKTTLAEQLSRSLGLVHIDVAAHIKTAVEAGKNQVHNRHQLLEIQAGGQL